MPSSNIIATMPSEDYGLMDSGDGEKLERFGGFILSRPDPQALWRKRLPEKEWNKADGKFIRAAEKGRWSLKKGVPEKWPVKLEGFRFWVKPTAFKHTGLFPEQAPNWQWMRGLIRGAGEREAFSGPAGIAGGINAGPTKILNLFGYTGGATLACASAGAEVVHVDGSKAAVTWARDNAGLSGLAGRPIRWITEDARAFAAKEIRRGRSYDGIIMDPPAFGHGPSNELWKIEEHFLPLMEDCLKLLKPEPLFLVVNGYSAGYSAVAYGNALLPLKEKCGGAVEIGELAIEEDGREEGKKEGRMLPAGIFARWSARNRT